ncbi:HAMP domain-containing sensor histidine kinase [Pelagicoccus sp. SDUM812002]|uniref:HAMP domain-containing sensor histidine kinase n=1 Tax=Pelagicoccus sp. SDUM812002 TaxID=3041266 RepID=UPI00280EBB69|nr:HAMP domain-containing sensor histidine kinase [Pelagicoccus sp. SDUM812002]MDQ8187273.1 HAMP domain-containing sensor histidine kinase [Pelagicoccus sp. SDUM812002]
MTLPRFNIASTTLVVACLSVAVSVNGGELSSEAANLIARYGSPSSQNFYANESGVRGTVTSIATLPTGELAVLTINGLFVFDGTNWGKIEEIPWSTDLKISPSGETTLSTSRGFYQVHPNSTGSFTPERLAGENYDSFALPALEHVAFAKGHTFGLAGNRLIAISPEGELNRYELENWAGGLFTIGDELYLLGGTQTGLNRWDWQNQSLVNSSQQLTAAGNYDWMLKSVPRAKGGVWLLSETYAVIGYDGTSFFEWTGNSQVKSLGLKVIDLVELSNGSLAIASANQGLYLFDEEARLTLHYNSKQDLPDDSIQRIGLDSQQGLWIATENCLTRLQIDFHNALFDDFQGIDSSVQSIAFFQDRIYLGTNEGLYVSHPNPRAHDPVFTHQLDQDNISDLLEHQGSLFLAGSTLTILSPQGDVYELSPQKVTTFLQPSAYPDLILASTVEGIALLAAGENDRWVVKAWLEGPPTDAYSLAETSEGTYLANYGNDQFARLELNENGGSYQLETFTGYHNGEWTIMASINQKTYLSGTPCLIWDPSTSNFVPDPKMGFYDVVPPFGFDQIYGPTQDETYVPVNSRSSAFLRRPSTHTVHEIAILKNDVDNRATCLAYDADGNAWAGGSFGLFYSKAPSNRQRYPTPEPRILSLTTSTKNQTQNLPHKQSNLTLSVQQNSLKLVASYPRFQNSKHQQFQILLNDESPETTPFSSANWREFSNLPPGEHIIVINVNDASGTTPSSKLLNLYIATPWYQTPLALALYLLIASFAVLVIIRLKTQTQRKHNQQLEELVQQRTKELFQTNHQLATQAEDLAEKNEELTATTEALSSTLHQLQNMQNQLVATARTAGKAEVAINVLHNVGNVLNSINVNLTTLSQRADQSNATKLAKLCKLIDSHSHDIETYLLKDPKGKKIPEYLSLLSQSLTDEIKSNQLELARINEHLDHVKKIVKAQQIHAKSSHIPAAIRLHQLCQDAVSIVAASSGKTQTKIEYDVAFDIQIETDKHLLLDILINLLSNAQEAIQQKAAPLGSIRISAQEDLEAKSITIQIADNGVGIAQDNTNKLYQHGFTTKPNGHGFGLHSAANAALSLGGNLKIESPGVGLGANATLSLPLNAPATPSSI